MVKTLLPQDFTRAAGHQENPKKIQGQALFRLSLAGDNPYFCPWGGGGGGGPPGPPCPLRPCRPCMRCSNWVNLAC